MQASPHIVDAELLDVMETKLGHLVARWRGSDDADQQQEFARQYRALLICMIELGFSESLDADAELPGELMPQEYLRLFE